MNILTLKEAKEKYVGDLRERGKATITVQVYDSILEKIIASSFKEGKTIDKVIVPHVVQVFKSIDKSGKSQGSVKRNKRVFCQFMKYAQDQGWIGYFPIPNEIKNSFRGSK